MQAAWYVSANTCLTLTEQLKTSAELNETRWPNVVLILLVTIIDMVLFF